MNILTPEAQEILWDPDLKSDVSQLPMLSRTPAERMQLAIDSFKDDRRRGVLLENLKERDISLDRGIEAVYQTPLPGLQVLDNIVYDAGIDVNRATLGSFGDAGEIYKLGMDFWNTTYPARAFNAICHHKFFESFLGEANIYTGALQKSGVRSNKHTFQAPRMRVEDGPNIVSAIDIDEPLITYGDRPVRDRERTMYQWGIEDIIAEVVTLPRGTLKERGVVSEVLYSDEEMQIAMEGTVGALASIEGTKDEWEVRPYKIGIVVTDEFISGRLRANLYMRTHARIGRHFNRACTIRGLNRIAGALKIGSTHYGTDYTPVNRSTGGNITGSEWGQLEDSYEVETMNRVVGKKRAIRGIKEMNMGTENQTYAQYYQRPTQFYDLGMMFSDIGLGGLNSNALDAVYTDTTIFSFDVMSTLLLITAPWLEQDQQERDISSGSVLTAMRIALTEEVEDPNSIRKVVWGGSSL